MNNITRNLLLSGLLVLAGFFLFVNGPLPAQGGNGGNHKDKPEIKESTETPDTPLAKLDRELKEAKSTTTALALIARINETVPQTDADMAILGQLMDKYPSEGQKAALKIKDPKLAKAVMKECSRQVDKFKADKDKDWKTLPENQRQEKFNALLNTHAMIAALGNLKNEEALPFLKQYITPEYDGTLSYTASQALGRIGDEAVLDEMVRDIGKTKEIDLSAFGDKAFVKIIKELDEPNISDKRKFALINQIKANRSPERKKALKELALKHEDEDIRNRSGQALINAMLLNPENGDSDFLYNWTPRAVNDLNAVWALTALRIHFPDKKRPLEKRFIPVLLDVLKKSEYGCSRSKAAELFGLCRIKESLPYLEECIEKDGDGNVRGACRHAYWEMTGKIPVIFHPDDVKEIDERDSNPVYIELYAKSKKDDPWTQKRLAIQQALKEYKKSHSSAGERK